jgi:hypothetical protein
MIKKNYIKTILILIGLFFLPNAIFACGNNSKMDCCKKEISTKYDKKECWCTTKSDKKSKNCGGKCGHSNCTTTSSICLSILTNNELFFVNNQFDFSAKEFNFFAPKSIISKGFLSIWLPPVIGLI